MKLNIQLLCIVIVASICACKENATATNQSVTPKIEGQSTHKYAKPGASVFLLSPSIVSANIGQSLHVNIVLQASSPAQKIMVNVAASQGLRLLGEQTSFHLEADSKNQFFVPVDVVADKNGRYYINLSIETDGEEKLSRNVSIIVQVGDATSAEKQQKPIRPSADKLIVMPAQETVEH